ncbi:vacuolar protein sorting 11 [Hibiscus trionum]|uniref:Vacuolar protein sorting 11 n=1 Tax=Hibiscus trionum TaxID=183268 RepID=A0A9W7M3S9_HIBTR|nr:vacuolar protein sorting 11 [Hibiscus trionum]
MYRRRKFDFFEEKLGGKKCKIPEEIAGKVDCASSGRGKLVIGCDDSTVSLLDRGLDFNFGFQAHTSSVLFLQMFKKMNKYGCSN